MSRDNSVGIEMGYGLAGRGSIPGSVKYFYHLHTVQTGFGARPASYPMGTGDSFPGGKAAGHLKLTSHLYASGKIAPVSTRGRMEPRTGIAAVEKRKISCLCRESMFTISCYMFNLIVTLINLIICGKVYTSVMLQ
jgi:hypothetical protein